MPREPNTAIQKTPEAIVKRKEISGVVFNECHQPVPGGSLLIHNPGSAILHYLLLHGNSNTDTLGLHG